MVHRVSVDSCLDALLELKIGQVIKCKVTALVESGATVVTSNGVDGLCSQPNLCGNHCLATEH